MGDDGAAASGDGAVRPMFMNTVGVDLSVSPRRTAVVVVEWGEMSATVGCAAVGVRDDDVVDAVAGAKWVGISAPFGWPRAMASALHSYGVTGEFPKFGKEAFRYRRTDLFVHECLASQVGRKVWPLSVSSDGIAMRAWRLALLRERLAERTGVRFDRSGADGIVEVFPGAALLLWGFERGVYRRGDGVVDEDGVIGAREGFLGSLEAVAPWLRWVDGARELCLENEDVVDGLICAFVARAAALGRVFGVDAAAGSDAQCEGWVHLPAKGCLGALVGDVGVEVGV
jgi:hypothetical protein